MADDRNSPVRVFKAKGVTVSVFHNSSDTNAWHKVAVQKVYRDGDQWKSSASLGRDDLPIARLLIGKAWEWILDHEAAAVDGQKHESHE